jgi:hypothetical protein
VVAAALMYGWLKDTVVGWIRRKMFGTDDERQIMKIGYRAGYDTVKRLFAKKKNSN